MTPVSPVLPGYEHLEVILAKDQPQYDPLPCAMTLGPSQPAVTRWRLTEEERQQIADGADVVLQQLTFGSPFQPVNLQIVSPDVLPRLVW
jgi:hypothetical protein